MRQDQADSPSQQNLQDSARATTDALDARLDKPYGTPTAVKVAAYQAAWGDLVRASGTFDVTLPPTAVDRIGEVITVKHPGSSGTLTVIPALATDTIDGAISKSVAAGDSYRYVCAELGKWIEMGSAASSGGGWVYAPTAVKTANYTMLAMYELARYDPTAGAITITLPTIAGAADIGKLVCIKNDSTNKNQVSTIAAAAGQSILDPSPYIGRDRESLVFCVVTATSWTIIAQYYNEWAF